MSYGDVTFEARFTPFRHLGVFVEQAAQWDWFRPLIEARTDEGRPVRILNLFAYTGVASLIAARAGAEVTHLDASKKAITWANRNQELAGLSDAPIRWIADDAVKFLRREVKRGRTYDGVLLDPPKYGRGTKGEVWQLYDGLPELLDLAQQVLSEDALFLVATVYAIRMSSSSLHYGLAEALGEREFVHGVHLRGRGVLAHVERTGVPSLAGAVGVDGDVVPAAFERVREGFGVEFAAADRRAREVRLEDADVHAHHRLTARTAA